MKKTNQNLETETSLGFTDITEGLKRWSINSFYKGDLIRNVLVNKVKKEFHNRGEYEGKEVAVGEFFVRDYGIRGRVFPLDEIIQEMKTYDIIIQNWKREEGFPPINIDAQIYHGFYIGEKIPVRISGRASQGDPSFKLFNHIKGYVNDIGNHEVYQKLGIGSEVVIEITGKLMPFGQLR